MTAESPPPINTVKVVLITLAAVVVASTLVAIGILLGSRSNHAAPVAGSSSTPTPAATTSATTPAATTSAPAAAGPSSAVVPTTTAATTTTTPSPAATTTTSSPSPAAPTTTSRPRPTLVDADWTKLKIPMDCGPPLTLRIHEKKFADVNADGYPDAVVIASCDPPAGTPPDVLYVFTGAPGPTAQPRLLTTLVPRSKDWQLSGLALGKGEVTVSLDAYSSPTVTRCCPDVHAEGAWGWSHGKFVFQQ